MICMYIYNTNPLLGEYFTEKYNASREMFILTFVCHVTYWGPMSVFSNITNLIHNNYNLLI